MGQVTPHFSHAELTKTSTGLPNRPTRDEWCRLRAVCSAVAEPWRERVGPLIVTSGYRTRAVNEAVRGSPTSQHCLGEALDVLPQDRPRAWRILLEMMAAGLPVDQACIYEATNHVHISHTARTNARREAWVKTARGVWVRWDAYDGVLR